MFKKVQATHEVKQDKKKLDLEMSFKNTTSEKQRRPKYQDHVLKAHVDAN